MAMTKRQKAIKDAVVPRKNLRARLVVLTIFKRSVDRVGLARHDGVLDCFSRLVIAMISAPHRRSQWNGRARKNRLHRCVQIGCSRSASLALAMSSSCLA